jgi:YD repeat-containing protein
MNERLKNLGGLFKDTRTRTIIIFTGIILVIAIIMGIVRFMGQTSGPASQAQVSGPGNIQSIPGGFDRPVSPQYAQLQEQQNQMQAQMASKTGTSSIPTIIRSSTFGQTGQTAVSSNACCNACCGQQAGGGAFPPKVSSPLKPGTLVYDANGNVIGTLGPDGKVRNANGLVVGTVGPDGLVRDANGNVIGAAGASPFGTPVYDANGHIIGYAGPDGKVRDANGNVIGTVGPDGLVRDANGNVVGKVGNTVGGTPVYDANGKLIGYAGPDGKVRDANGNVIGTVGPDGTVRDANGKVIGKAVLAPGSAGTPIYDAQGRLIGYAGPDGVVRDPSGKVIGKLGADGKVRNANGDVIGQTGNPVPGTPIYDSNGRLIGVVGPDGKVRDANGNVVGVVGPDGIVRDAQGNPIGKVGNSITGTPVYDAQGRLIGIAGPDGKVRDASGKVIGTVGIDGVVRDAQGNPIGSTNVGTAAAGRPGAAEGIPSATSLAGAGQQQPQTQLQVLMQRQQALVSAQRADQLRNQVQAAMTGQANQLLLAWGPPSQSYVPGIPPSKETGAGAGGLSGAGMSGQSPAVKAGTIMFAVLMTAINTDEPGPVLATIVEGKFKGGRLIGSIQNQGQKVQLNFNTLTLPNQPSSISINAVAIDEKTARTAFSSKTDNHYLLRYGSLFAASFLEGYGQATLTSGSQVINNENTTVTSAPKLSPQGKFEVALGNVGNRYSSAVQQLFNTPPTVHVYPGTAMGLLFLSDLAALPPPSA